MKCKICNEKMSYMSMFGEGGDDELRNYYCIDRINFPYHRYNINEFDCSFECMINKKHYHIRFSSLDEYVVLNGFHLEYDLYHLKNKINSLESLEKVIESILLLK